jgi:hypothetical protein
MSSQLEGRFEVLGAYLSERESDLMPIIIGVDQFRDQHAVGLWLGKDICHHKQRFSINDAFSTHHLHL